MKNPIHTIIRVIYHLLILFVLLLATNSVFLLASGAYDSVVMIVAICMCFFFWLWPGACTKDIRDGRIKQLWFGNIQLRLFLEALVITITYTVLELFVFKNIMGYVSASDSESIRYFAGIPWEKFGAHLVIATVFLSITFWIGIIRVYLTSVQLGIKTRVIGILCGLIFPLNLIVLGIIIRTTLQEVKFENDKAILNETRKADRICATKYPVLLLHGVFFRDFKYFDYWGRVPGELFANGCTYYYGEQQSAASVESCGLEIARKIKEITDTTGCEKVNIIAHSKGGLDARSAMTDPDIARRVASLTTINTPHRGCEFADYLLDKIPEKTQQVVAKGYNKALSKLGDYNPDFIVACRNLTHSFCAEFNEKVKDPEGVYIQSYGSLLKNHRGGQFPLNLTYGLVNAFDGGNDGLVGEASFPWGSDFHLITAPGRRGISHGDVIDLNRENIPGYDVREFYVQLVADLKSKGF